MVIQIGKNTITSEKGLEAVNDIGRKDDFNKNLREFDSKYI
jgi:hypothetical protein